MMIDRKALIVLMFDSAFLADSSSKFQDFQLMSLRRLRAPTRVFEVNQA
jgi:hypothetical protein